MVARDITLARLTGGRVHIAHLSTRGAVALVRQAKAEGLPVTAEAAPHHFTLTEEAVEGYNTNAKMAPPLRLAEDVEAVKEGLRDGTIDAIATDHAPHHRDEKEVEFDQAANGISRLGNGVAAHHEISGQPASCPCRRQCGSSPSIQRGFSTSLWNSFCWCSC